MKTRTGTAGMLLVAGIAAWGAESAAQQPQIITGEPLPAERMADVLFPDGEVKTRSLVPKPKAIGIPIQFELDSAEIQQDSRPYLDEVGRMMKLERLQGRHLRVEGHTDASGSEGHNQALSERRARAVARYLQSEHGVEPSRLVVVGRGEADPLPDRPGEDPLNRRVQFSAAR